MTFINTLPEKHYPFLLPPSCLSFAEPKPWLWLKKAKPLDAMSQGGGQKTVAMTAGGKGIMSQGGRQKVELVPVAVMVQFLSDFLNLKRTLDAKGLFKDIEI